MITLNPRWRELIAEREAFVNGTGTLEGEYVDGLSLFDGQLLEGADLEQFEADHPFINYVVWSYNVPIHWVTLDDRWHTIAKCPSKTTAGHRNLCPGYRQTREKKP